MPVRLSLLWRATPLVLLLPLLAACGPSRDQFAPACPAANVLPPTGAVSQYRPGSSGRDLTDLVFQGQVERIIGKCQPGDDKNTLEASVSLVLDFARGPAMQGDSLAVPVFIAVTVGDRILTKKVFTVGTSFPSNTDRVRYGTAPVDMSLPISATKSGAAYTILAGFQLTPEQLAASRARGQ